MPVYKYAANRVLTFCENLVCARSSRKYPHRPGGLQQELLEALPFARISDDFIFDNQIIVQAVVSGEYRRALLSDALRGRLVVNRLRLERPIRHRRAADPPRKYRLQLSGARNFSYLDFAPRALPTAVQ